MTALSDAAVAEWMRDGRVVIHPFREDDLGSASYDVRLGPHYFKAASPLSDHDGGGFFNMYSEESVRAVWGSPRRAIRALDVKRWRPGADWTGIGDDDEVIVLEPRANLLCHTLEFIGARSGATTMMKARSSIGRSLINVCACAGMGDPGYVNRWTMEVCNRSDWCIPLVVGRRIAQIVFLETDHGGRTYAGKYQATGDLAELEARWRPEDMLPRLYRDRDIGLIAE